MTKTTTIGSSDTYPPTAPGPLSAAVAELRGVSKNFGDVQAVQHCDLSIAPGEFLSFLGPSGCGKTTVLRMLAGFETPSSGTVLIDGKDVSGLAAHQRPVNMVFQSYALFPHLTVGQNIAYGLKQKRPKLPRMIITDKVKRVLENHLNLSRTTDTQMQDVAEVLFLATQDLRSLRMRKNADRLMNEKDGKSQRGHLPYELDNFSLGLRYLFSLCFTGFPPSTRKALPWFQLFCAVPFSDRASMIHVGFT